MTVQTFEAVWVGVGTEDAAQALSARDGAGDCQSRDRPFPNTATEPEHRYRGYRQVRKANKIPLFMNHSRLPQDFVEQERSSLRSRSSHDSDDSLAALELFEGAAPTAHRKTRTLSGSSFGFERDLLPLSASLSESEEVRSASGEKTIGFINGALELASR